MLIGIYEKLLAKCIWSKSKSIISVISHAKWVVFCVLKHFHVGSKIHQREKEAEVKYTLCELSQRVQADSVLCVVPMEGFVVLYNMEVK